MHASSSSPAIAASGRDRAILLSAGLLSVLLAAALTRGLTGAAPVPRDLWLAIHLMTVVPAVPLGAYILLRRKGDRLHRLLGRLWALLMVAGALSSFGLHGLMGGLSPIHLLSVLVLVTVPRAVWHAMRGEIAAHRRKMTIVYASLVAAGFFTFLPGRLLSGWLLG